MFPAERVMTSKVLTPTVYMELETVKWYYIGGGGAGVNCHQMVLDRDTFTCIFENICQSSIYIIHKSSDL